MEEKAALPTWAARLLTLAMIAMLTAVGGYQLRLIAEVSALTARVDSLERQIIHVQDDQIGIRRFEDFERQTDTQLREIKDMLVEHEREQRVENLKRHK